MSQSGRVILSNGLGEFFRQEVSAARDSMGLELTELTEHYLVNMLCDFSRLENQPKPGEEPLALLYKRALEASWAERAQLLKNLGDLALYVAGFFTEHVERSMVDIDYYISMGGGAYNHLSDLVSSQRSGETFAHIYCQLAEKFADLVELLNKISGQSRVQDQQLLRMYDRWVRTRNQRVRERLVQSGLIPHDELPDEYVQ